MLGLAPDIMPRFHTPLLSDLMLHKPGVRLERHLEAARPLRCRHLRPKTSNGSP